MLQYFYMKFHSFLKKLFFRCKRKLCRAKFPVYAFVCGIKDPAAQSALLQSREGDELQIVHAPYAENDYAVFVYNIEIGALIGTLSDPLAQRLLSLFGKEFCIDGDILEITGGNFRSCKLRIYDTSEMLQGEVLPMIVE